MPPLSALPAFVAASLVLLAIPGPAVMFIVARSGAQGRRAGLVSVLGVHAASIVHVLGAVVGLSAVLVRVVDRIHGGQGRRRRVSRVLGVRVAPRCAPGEHSPSSPLRGARGRLFAEGFLVNLFNPKVALFFLAFLPQFVARGHGAIWSQTLTLGLIYIALGLVSDSAYALAGAGAGRWLASKKRTLRAGSYGEGGMLIGLGVLAFALPHRVRSR